MTESLQNRQAPTRKLLEAYGGKLDSYFVIPGTNSGVIIAEFPDILAVQAVTMEIGASVARARRSPARLAQFGSWVTIIQGVIFVICMLIFRRGVVGEIAHFPQHRTARAQADTAAPVTRAAAVAMI